MIFDTSYSDKETTRQINKAVGPPFSWKERWKMGGIGSRRMVISHISEEYQKYMKADHYETKANLELRPEGIIIHFRHRLQAYSWIMPYSALKVKHDTSLRLESEGKFIQFDQVTGNESFIQRMMNLSH